jgi:hypothetical protein
MFAKSASAHRGRCTTKVYDKVRAALLAILYLDVWTPSIIFFANLVGENRRDAGETLRQSSLGYTTKTKIKSGVSIPKLSLYLIALCYATLFVTMGCQSTEAYIKNYESKPHHNIFDNLGKMSTGITNINVAIPLNISILEQQIKMFSEYVHKLTSFKNNNTNLSAKDKTALHNLEQLTISIASNANRHLDSLLDS